MADVDLTQVPSQTGTATLDSSDGKTLQSTGDLSGDEGLSRCATIFRMLQDTSKCLADEPMRRLSISFTDHVYVVTLGESHIYIVKCAAPAAN